MTQTIAEAGRAPGGFDDLEDDATFYEDGPAPRDRDPEGEANQTYLEAAAQFAANKPAEVTLACPACKGRGRFYSYIGRDVGDCFKCKGTGRVTKSQLARQEGARKAKVTREKNEAERRQAFLEAHKEQVAWARRKDGTFDFATKMVDALGEYGSWTEGQLAAIDRCIIRDKEYEARRNAPGVKVEGALDLSPIPEGYYADPEDASRLKLRIDHPTDGKWADWIFVKDAAVYGVGKKYGTQRPGGTYVGEVVEVLKKILADPKAASAAYGRLVGRCGVCGRPLEDPESIARGIGPICAGRFE